MKGRLERQQKAESSFKQQLNEQLLSFYNYLAADDKEYTTRIKYTRIIRNFLETVRDENPQNIDLDAVSNYLSKYSSGGSDANRILVWSALHKYLSYLLGRKIIPEDYCKYVNRGSVKDDVKQVYMTSDELCAVKRNIIQGGQGSNVALGRRETWKERDLAIFYLLSMTGVRVSALVEINMEDYDRTTGQLRILDKGRKYFEHNLDTVTMEVLEYWFQRREELLGDVKCVAMFISNRRKRITDRSVRNIVEKYTGFLPKHISPHKFRSSYGSNLYLKTHDIRYVQQAMGHSDTKTTERYLKGLEHDNRISINIMSDLLKD